MFDRNDMDFRINTHRMQIEIVNRNDWQTASVARSVKRLRRLAGAVPVAVATGLYSGSLATLMSDETAGRKTAGSVAA